MKINKTNFRPAEWAKQERVWLSWPNNPETWPTQIIAKVQDEFAAFIAILTQFQKVSILYDDGEDIDVILKKIDPYQYVNKNLHLVNMKTNDSWIRDYGPEFLLNEDCNEKHLLDWGYNAWGGKYPPFQNDNKIPIKIAKHCNYSFTTIPIILEGGAVEFNGQGIILTTENCLLNPNRNPNLKSKSEIEKILKKNFNCHTVIWLQGELVGDDTDGHIDNIARFANRNTIICAYEEDSSSPNFKCLDFNWNFLKKYHSEFKLVKLPMPDKYELNNMELPASYANFLIINGAVIVPQFGLPQDQIALSILTENFPNHKVIGMSSKYLIWGQGCFHCLSKQEPALQ